jgi:hypothetical protein
MRDDIFTNLPTLDDHEQEECVAPITLQELTTALRNTSQGKVPDLEGLTYEFYKEFWELIGPLLLKVATTSLQEGQLSLSMRSRVITMVPKKEDHTDLSNWHPITLLNTGYIIITRCFASRINAVLPALITTDQSRPICVPGRTI